MVAWMDSDAPAGAAPGLHAQAHDAHACGRWSPTCATGSTSTSLHRDTDATRAGAQRDRPGHAAGDGAAVRRRLPPQPRHRQLRPHRRGDEPDRRRRHAPHVERCRTQPTGRSGTPSTVEPRRPLGAPGCGATVWFTGLSGSGKSTLADAVAARLLRDGRAVVRARRRQRPPRAQRRPRVLRRRPGRERPARRRGRPADGRRRARRARAGDQPVPRRPRPRAGGPRRRRPALRRGVRRHPARRCASSATRRASTPRPAPAS